MSIPSAKEFRTKYDEARAKSEQVKKMKSNFDFIAENQQRILKACIDLIQKYMNNMYMIFNNEPNNNSINLISFLWIPYQNDDEYRYSFSIAVIWLKQNWRNLDIIYILKEVERRYNKHFNFTDVNDNTMECKIEIIIKIP